MVFSFRDGSQWDEWAGPIRCALKLVKLAAGTFESAEVLQPSTSDDPSWISSGAGTGTGASVSSTAGAPTDALRAPAYSSSDDHRTEWRRPWREGKSKGLVRWEKAGLQPPRYAPPKSLRRGTEEPPSSRIRRVVVDIPSPTTWQPPGYTTKYFGMVDGALAIMSKVDHLELRPTTSSRSAHQLPGDTVIHKPSGSELEPRQQHRRKGANGNLHRRRRPGVATDLRENLTTQEEHKAPNTAQEAPVTKPVEGPVPPPWSGSKLGVNGDPSIHVEVPRPDSSWGSAMLLSEMAIGSSGGRDNVITTDVVRERGILSGDSDAGVSSFLSMELENVSRGTTPSVDSGERPLNTETNDRGVILAVDTNGHLAAATTTVSGVVAATAVTQKRRKREEMRTAQYPDALATSEGRPIGDSVVADESCVEIDATKPQPQLYDIWIPQQSFHGKALASSKRWKGGPSTLAGGGKGAASPSAGAEISGLVGSNTPSHRYHHRCLPTNENNVQHAHHVDSVEGFAVDDKGILSPSVEGSPIVPNKSAAESFPFPPGAISAGVSRNTGDGGDSQGELERPDEDADSVASGLLLHLDAALAMDVREWLGDEHDDGFESGGDVAVFDYAKKFSWQTVAAEVSAEVGDARAKDEDTEKEFESLSQEERAVAIERARARAGYAAQTAVGRLRAPQSVYHPLHRTPSRPEMRRSITHGRFSPAGRKLWRRSDGLSPRTGQLCLRAAPPTSRINATPALEANWGDAVGGGGGNSPILAPGCIDLMPTVSVRKERQRNSIESCSIEGTAGESGKGHADFSRGERGALAVEKEEEGEKECSCRIEGVKKTLLVPERREGNGDRECIAPGVVVNGSRNGTGKNMGEEGPPPSDKKDAREENAPTTTVVVAAGNNAEEYSTDSAREEPGEAIAGDGGDRRKGCKSVSSSGTTVEGRVNHKRRDRLSGSVYNAAAVVVVDDSKSSVGQAAEVPARYLRYSVTIPWNGRVGDGCVSAGEGSDR